MDQIRFGEPGGAAGHRAASPLSPVVARRSTRTEDDRPPYCPTCHRRLVILSTHLDHDDSGRASRYQLWGCPRGHATARRLRGSFLAVEVLPDPLTLDDEAGPR